MQSGSTRCVQTSPILTHQVRKTYDFAMIQISLSGQPPGNTVQVYPCWAEAQIEAPSPCCPVVRCRIAAVWRTITLNMVKQSVRLDLARFPSRVEVEVLRTCKPCFILDHSFQDYMQKERAWQVSQRLPGTAQLEPEIRTFWASAAQKKTCVCKIWCTPSMVTRNDKSKLHKEN